MLILTLRTDKPEAEIGLYEDGKRLTYEVWTAHRQLAETIHSKTKAMLDEQDKTPEDINGIVIFKGPGSFTGLRIGMSVANALAYSLDIPIIAADGDEWVEKGVKALLSGKGGKTALPEYGGEIHITLPK